MASTEDDTAVIASVFEYASTMCPREVYDPPEDNPSTRAACRAFTQSNDSSALFIVFKTPSAATTTASATQLPQLTPPQQQQQGKRTTEIRAAIGAESLVKFASTCAEESLSVHAALVKSSSIDPTRAVASQVSTVTVGDGMPLLDALHAVVRAAVSPLFSGHVATAPNRPGIELVRQKLAELELALASCRHSVQIDSVDLEFQREVRDAAAAAQARHGRALKADDLAGRLEDPVFLNSVQASVNRWVSQLRKLLGHKRLAEMPEESSAMQEVTFWAEFDATMRHVLAQMAQPEFETSMGILKMTRRLVTASSFEELKVKEVAQSVSAVRAFLKDLPLDAVLTSPDLPRLRASLGEVFAYVRDRTVTAQYPPTRLNRLFEAIGRDAADRAVTLLRARGVMRTPLEDLRSAVEEAAAVFTTFSKEKERLHVKRTLQQQAASKDQPVHATAAGAMTAIQRRLTAIAVFREQHEELRAVVSQVLGSAAASTVGRDIDDAFSAAAELDAIGATRDKWDEAVSAYELKIGRVEAQLIARLRESLAQVKDAEEMFRVFSQFNPLFCRPRIRGAVQEYQTQLIARVRSKIDALQEKFRASRSQQASSSSSSSSSLTVMRDLPTLISRVLWNLQIQRQLESLLEKVESVLGQNWHEDSEGQVLRSQGLDLLNQLNPSTLIEEWLTRTRALSFNISGRLFAIIERERHAGSSRRTSLTPASASAAPPCPFTLEVNFDEAAITWVREVRNLKHLRFDVPIRDVSTAIACVSRYPLVITLREVLKLYNGALRKVTPEVAPLLASFKTGVQMKLKEGINHTWEKTKKVEPYLEELSELVTTFASKVDTVVAKREAVRKLLDELKTATYDRAAIETVTTSMQRVADDLSSFSNLERWVSSLEANIESILLARLAEALEIWTCEVEGVAPAVAASSASGSAPAPAPAPQKPAAKIVLSKVELVVTMHGREVAVEPHIEHARIAYYSSLSQWLGVILAQKALCASTPSAAQAATRRRLLAKLPRKALDRALSAVEARVGEVEAYVRTWLQYQALWDMTPHVVEEAIGVDLAKWQQVLREVKQCCAAFATPETSRDFGIVTVNFRKVKKGVANRYADVLRELLAHFAGMLGERMRAAHVAIKKAREDLEGFVFNPASTEASISFVILSQELNAQQPRWGEDVKAFRAGQELLSKSHYHLPADWLETEVVEGEYGAFNEVLARRLVTINEVTAQLQAQVVAGAKSLDIKVAALEESWRASRPLEEKTKYRTALDVLSQFQQRLTDANGDIARIAKAKVALAIDVNVSRYEERLREVEAELKDIAEVWAALTATWQAIDALREMPWRAVVPKKLRKDLEEQLEKLQLLPNRIRQYATFGFARATLNGLLRGNLIVTDLRSEAIKPRHWDMLKKRLGASWVIDDLTLGQIWDAGIQEKEATFREIITLAQGELGLEEFLKQVRELWQNQQKFDLVSYQGKCQLIRNWEELFAKTSDHLTSLVAMKASPYFKEFAAEAAVWEEKLTRLQELLEVWVDVQRRWVYLEGVFNSGGESAGLLPQESARFRAVNNEFIGLMRKVQTVAFAADVLGIEGIQKVLSRLAEQLARIQKALGEFLEKQRTSFPRYFFIGDEDLLEIIGNARDISKAQKHLKKMFSGVSSLLLAEDGTTICGVQSPEGEEVRFIQPVAVVGSDGHWMTSDGWLTAVERAIREVLAASLVKAVADRRRIVTPQGADFRQELLPWIEGTLSQLVILAAEVEWCAAVERALAAGGGQAVEAVAVAVSAELEVLADSVLREMKGTTRKKCEHLMSILVHQRDVSRGLARLGVRSALDFEWLYNLRYYYTEVPPEGDPLASLFVRIANASFNYGWEYLGVSDFLVRTPLIDRVYVTLTQALDARMGGNPFGPAGTGKCLAPETPVLLGDGRTVRADEIGVGDILVGDDGSPRVVLSTVSGEGPLYRVRPRGESNGGYVCNDAHLLVFESDRSSVTRSASSFGATLGKPALLDDNVYRGFRRPVERFPLESDLQALIDAHAGNGQIHDTEFGHFCGLSVGDGRELPAPVSNIARELAVTENSIPPQLLGASRDVRLHVLAGIIDAAGRWDDELGHYEIALKHQEPATQTATLSRGLGLRADVSDGCRVLVSGKRLCEIPVAHQRVPAVSVGCDDGLRYAVEIEALPRGRYVGFQLGMFKDPEDFGKFCRARTLSAGVAVDVMCNSGRITPSNPDGSAAADGRFPGRFLLGDYSVTHNTEGVKALGSALGKSVVVFCCDEGFSATSISRILAGLCMCGFWGCFDEFNRLDERTLSAVSQQIQAIQEAIRAGAPGLDLGGQHVEKLNTTTGVFVTMNPGYAGRSNLPDNLKQLFRSVAMITPDREAIAQVMLFSQGFRSAEKLAAKVVPLFELCREQLSNQAHYDFGLRALKSVLISAGNLKRQQLVKEAQQQQQVQQPPDELEAQEQVVLIRSIRETTVPKLVAEDIPLLYSLVRDVFPGADLRQLELSELRSHIADICSTRCLAAAADWTEKLVQLFQIQQIHHGLMLVGPAATGKTAARNVLLEAMERLDGIATEQHVIDPKALSKELLYGTLDSTTREWTDGLFTSILRKIVSGGGTTPAGGQRGPKRHWIVFDGNVDPEWVEVLNALLDDNKLLTLPNGERLALPRNVRIVFEVQDLRSATLATVSRCGMVWFSEDIVTPPMLSFQFLQRLRTPDKATRVPDEVLRVQRACADALAPMFAEGGLVEHALADAAARQHVMEFTRMRVLDSLFSLLSRGVVSVVERNAAHPEAPLSDADVVRWISSWALFSIPWSIGGSLALREREEFSRFVHAEAVAAPGIDQAVRERLPPLAKQGQQQQPRPLLDYGVSLEGMGAFFPWDSVVPTVDVESHKVGSPDVVIPTVDTTRHAEVMKMWLADRKPLILCGPPGSGKCLAPDTPVLLADGCTSRAEDIKPGDLLVSDDGTPRVVLSTIRGTGQLFRVRPNCESDGGFVCNDKHLLVFGSSARPRVCERAGHFELRFWKQPGPLEPPVETTVFYGTREEALSAAQADRERFGRHTAPFTVPCEAMFEASGGTPDGHLVGVRAEVRRFPCQFDLQALVNRRLKETGSNAAVRDFDIARFVGLSLGESCDPESRHDCATVRLAKELGLVGAEKIPSRLLGATRPVRLHLLAGILDSDLACACDEGLHYEVVHPRQRVARQIISLARGLGLRAAIHETVSQGNHFRVDISGQNLHDVPVVRRKLPEQASGRRAEDDLHYGVEIQKLERGAYCGFQVGMFGTEADFEDFRRSIAAGDDAEAVLSALYNEGKIVPSNEGGAASKDGRYAGRFLLGDYTVTHNTMTLQSTLSALSGDFEVATLNFSSATTPDLLMKTFSRHCECKRAPGGETVMRPPGGRWLVVFCDEINLPQADRYGTQRVITFMRQLVENSGFWRFTPQDRSWAWVRLEHVQFVGACNPPTDPGRVPLGARFLRHAPVVLVDFPSESSLRQIYGTFVRALMRLVRPPLRPVGQRLTEAMIEWYVRAQRRFTPDMQAHYVFSPRELSRWVRALHEALREERSDEAELRDLVMIWAHEGLRLFSDRLVHEQERLWTDDLLRELVGKHFPELRAEFEDVGRAKHNPLLFCNWLTKKYQRVSIEELRAYVKGILRVFVEEELDVQLVLFDEVLEHILRIDRTFRQPQGHVLLVGMSGGGKTVLSRFVAWKNALSVFSIKVNNKYKAADFDNDLRSVMRRSGCGDERICFIFDESNALDSGFLEKMNTLLAAGDVPGLFEGDEWGALMHQIRDAAQRLGPGSGVDAASGEDELYRWFVCQVRRNLHVVFTMNPASEDFHNRAATSPALFNRCVIDWFGDWSPRALFQVGTEFTASLDLDDAAYAPPAVMPADCPVELEPASATTHRQAVVASLVYVHLSIEEANARLLRLQGRHNYVTPRHFLDFISHFSKMANSKRAELEEEQLHLNLGLEKLLGTEAKVKELQDELRAKGVELAAKERAANEKLTQMLRDQEVAEQKKRDSVVLQGQLAKQKEEVRVRKAKADADLQRAEPALREAQRAVTQIKKQNLDEVKALPNPPPMVRMTMECVTYMLTGKKHDWPAIRKALADTSFIPSVVNFNTDNLTERMRAYVRQTFLSDAKFTYDAVEYSSKACGPLYKWIDAQVNFSEIKDRVEPLKQEAESLQQAADKLQQDADALEKTIGELERSIGQYKREYGALIVETKEIEREIKRVQAKVDRSVALVSNLSDERRRWESERQTFQQHMQTLVFNALLCSAALAYSGFFDQHFRAELMGKWTAFAEAIGGRFRSDLSLVEYLSSPEERLQWQANTLPADDLCAANAIMLKHFNRYPLVIDPSGQAMEFLMNQLREKKITKTSFLDTSFMKNLESSLRFGYPLLVCDVESIDPVLNPVLNREIHKKGGRVLIRLGDQEIDFSPSFAVFLFTRDPTAHFTPDLCSRVTLVNFTVTQSSLESQCLHKTLASERPDAHKKMGDLLKMQGEFRVKLRGLQKRLLAELSQAKGNILDNDSVLGTLENLKREAGDVVDQVRATEDVMEEIEKISATYKPMALACSKLYFAMEDLSHIHFLYHFSLRVFLTIFRSVVPETGGGVGVGSGKATPDLAGIAEQDRRMRLLTDGVFRAVFRRVCDTLLHEDQTAFGIRLALIRVRGTPNEIDERDVDFLLRADDLATPAPPPDALRALFGDTQWGVVRELAKLDTFRRIEVHMQEHAEDWAKWASLPAPEREQPPQWSGGASQGGGAGYAVRTAFWSCMLIRAVRPDRFVPAAARFLTVVFGDSFLSTTEPDLARAAEESSPSSPIMLCSKPGYDSSAKVAALAAASRKACTPLAIGSEGFGTVERAIADATKSGEWVLLKNVHLAPQWLVAMEKKLHGLSPHPQFRIFMTSELHPKLPASLLRQSHVVTYEPPPGVMATLRHALGHVSPARMDRAPVERSRLYFLLCWFHAVISERLRYAPHGWTKAFEFGETDQRGAIDTLDAWLDMHSRGRANIDPERIPWVALRTLISQSLYGGRVDNPQDQRLLLSIVERLFVPQSFDERFPLLLSGSRDVTAPDKTTHAECLRWAESLVVPESPSWLGLPDDADVLLMANQTKRILLKISKMQGFTEKPVGQAASRKQQQQAAQVQQTPEMAAWLKSLCEDAERWLAQLPAAEKLPPTSTGQQDAVVWRCIERDARAGMALVARVRVDLELLLDTARGKAKSTNQTRSVTEDLSRGTVPRSWKPYPLPELLSPGAFIRDLARRAAQIKALVADRGALLRRVWLGGLLHPEAYITATRQAAARAGKCSLETLRLEVVLLSPDETTQRAPTADEFAIDGMTLENATLSPDGVLAPGTSGSATKLGTAIFAWKPRLPNATPTGQSVAIPVYLNETRAECLFVVDVKCPAGSDQSLWFQRSIGLIAWHSI